MIKLDRSIEILLLISLSLLSCGKQGSRRSNIASVQPIETATTSSVNSHIFRSLGAPQIPYQDKISSKNTNLYFPIPDSNIHSDGIWSPFIIKLSPRFNECGTSSELKTLSKKIEDCKSKNPYTYQWSGKSMADAGQGDWKLVLRDENQQEIWINSQTKALWSSSLAQTHWCQGSGNEQEVELVFPSSDDDQDSIKTSCSELIKNQGIQLGVCDAYTQKTSSKFGLSLKWRLPSLNDWLLAETQGARFVFQDIKKDQELTPYWSATTSSKNISQAWVFNHPKGLAIEASKNSKFNVRCIAYYHE